MPANTYRSHLLLKLEKLIHFSLDIFPGKSVYIIMNGVVIFAWPRLVMYFSSQWPLMFDALGFVQNRDKTRVVTYRCPSNTAVQVYNYQHKTARVVFGPELVVLDPHETFNVLFLSGEDSYLAGHFLSPPPTPSILNF